MTSKKTNSSPKKTNSSVVPIVKPRISFKNKIRPAANNVSKVLNLLPNILFVLVNILKTNKIAIIPAMIFIKTFIASKPLSQNNNNIGVLSGTQNNVLGLDNKARKFLEKFSTIFVETYSKTNDVDKVLMLLAFIDIISNELPKITNEANKTKYVDNTKIFMKLITNAKELQNDYNKAVSK